MSGRVLLARAEEALNVRVAATTAVPRRVGAELEPGQVGLLLDRLDGLHELADIDSVAHRNGCHGCLLCFWTRDLKQAAS
jgi:hypothetical protein